MPPGPTSADRRRLLTGDGASLFAHLGSRLSHLNQKHQLILELVHAAHRPDLKGCHNGTEDWLNWPNDGNHLLTGFPTLTDGLATKPTTSRTNRISSGEDRPLQVAATPCMPMRRQLLTTLFLLNLYVQLFSHTSAVTSAVASSWYHHYNTPSTRHEPVDRLGLTSQAVARHIPSARYYYTSSTPAQNSLELHAKREKILALHSQLNQLKRELDAELGGTLEQRTGTTEAGSSGRQPMKSIGQTNTSSSWPPAQPVLGSPCLSTSFCSKSIRNSRCDLDSFTCACMAQHVQLDKTTCLAPALLGYDCQLDDQCRQRVPESVCFMGTCACPREGFVPYRKNKCLTASKLDDYCLLDDQCRLRDKHSFCRWKIQNIYGTCKCPPNYKLLTDDQNNLRCIPRLGDACLSHQECQMATANSICVQPDRQAPAVNVSVAILKSMHATIHNRWQTSSASGSRCVCMEGFEASRDELACVQISSRSAPSMTTTTTTTIGTNEVIPSSAVPIGAHQQDSHKYEMIVIPASVALPSGTDIDVGQARSNASSSSTTVSPLELSSSTEREELEIKVMPMESEARRKQAAATIKEAPAKTAPTSTTSTTTSTTTTSTTTKPSAPVGAKAPTNTSSLSDNLFRMSSLGKSCSSRAECQARDPNSDCIGGICECLAPSARCRASRTGCHPDTFQCRNGHCISWYFVCDQFKNCDDGSDEEDCAPGKCPRESFQCATDGACLSKGKVCDGKRDCADGSDESECGQDVAAISVDHTNKATNSNGSETNLTTTSHRCHLEAFTCSNGQCLPSYVFCNAVEDCDDGSDEGELVCERKRAPLPLPLVQAASLVGAGQGASQAGAAVMPSAALATSARNQIGSSVSPVLAFQSGARDRNSAGQQESPLVKTDRAAIERLMAALALGKWTPDSPRPPESDNNGNNNHWPIHDTNNNNGEQTGVKAATQAQYRRKRTPRTGSVKTAYAVRFNRLTRKQAPITTNAADLGECPRWAFTCRNGKCRSSAILCSGVDGCGDNSDEDRCEVCQCEAPPPVSTDRSAGAGPTRAPNSRRRNAWATTWTTNTRPV